MIPIFRKISRSLLPQSWIRMYTDIQTIDFFGEIPIKGLPRYLAIIQGFIGWFMLTIFSVSLISQLLN